MDEITIDDKTYISSKRAAAITGYAKDYVGQLCREGRVEARLIGRSWYVLEESIRKHRFESEEKPAEADEPALEPEQSSEITNNEAVWTESVYTSEEVEMLPVMEEKTESDSEVPPNPEEEVVESASEPEPTQETTIEESGPIAQEKTETEEKESSTLEPQSHAEWENWFSKGSEVKIQRAEEPVSPRVESYKPYTEEKEPAQQIRVHKNVAFDIGAIGVPEERVVAKEQRKEEHQIKKPNYLIIKALAFAVIVLFVSLAVIGSGMVETLEGTSSWGIINILGGTSLIN